MISKAGIPNFPTFYLIDSLELGFLTLLKIINILIVFMLFNLSEIYLDDF